MISIHALLAESDLSNNSRRFLCPHFYPRSPCGERLCAPKMAKNSITISIHALLAESDNCLAARPNVAGEFLSTLSLRRATRTGLLSRWIVTFLSTLSLRRATSKHPGIAARAVFLSTLSLRRATERVQMYYNPHLFLSTLSLRRATTTLSKPSLLLGISIHALLAESDTGFLYFVHHTI